MRGRFYIEDLPPADAEVYGNLKFARIVGPGEGGECYGKAWRGKAGKPYAYYRFSSPEKREAWIAREKQAEDGRDEYRKQREASKQTQLAEMLIKIQVGTILTGSWGYDQTNPEIWQVTERRGHAIWLRPLACESVPGSAGFMSEMIKPIPGKFCGEAVKRMITANGVKINECCTITPDRAESAHYSSCYA